MNSYKYSLIQAKEFLEQLNIDEHTNALWDVLHLARWHQGIDWIRWMDENKPLVEMLIKYKYISMCPDELLNEIRRSFREFKKLDR